MSDKRIWLDAYGNVQGTPHKRYTAYVRADLYAAAQDRVEKLEEALRANSPSIMASDIAHAARAEVQDD